MDYPKQSLLPWGSHRADACWRPVSQATCVSSLANIDSGKHKVATAVERTLVDLLEPVDTLKNCFDCLGCFGWLDWLVCLGCPGGPLWHRRGRAKKKCIFTISQMSVGESADAYLLR